MHGEQRAWAVVLAGGDGVRLRTLARFLYGRDLPKQFLPLLDGRSLLQATLKRISGQFAPDRIVVVVGEPYHRLASRQLRDHAGVHLIAQPRNLGTGLGILLPLARIRAHEPDARIAIFPSDHHVRCPEPLLDGVRRSLGSTSFDRILVGVEPESPDTELGWIVPKLSRSSAGEPHSVIRFVEKPSPPLARQLLRQGALWNTFLLVGKLRAIWDMVRTQRPRLASQFDRYADSIGRPEESVILESIYGESDPVDFSRDILERAGGLGVVQVRGAGWSDWGSPERVLRSLRGTPDHERILARIGGATRQRGADSFTPRPADLLESPAPR
jgi:mannose-1-phosphate guanylyltransferase